MAEAIDGRRAEQLVLEGLAPFLKIKIAGDDRRALFVALGHHVVEILILVERQRLEAEVVNDEQVHPGQLLELPIIAADRAGSLELLEHLGQCQENHVLSATDGTVSQGLGQMAFPCAAGAGNEDIGFFLQKPAGGHVQDEGPVNGRIEGEVEAFQGLLTLTAGPA